MERGGDEKDGEEEDECGEGVEGGLEEEATQVVFVLFVSPSMKRHETLTLSRATS